MHRPRITLFAATVAAAALAAAGAAVGSVATSTAWHRISGPSGAGSQLGLARTADGLLHVIWNRGTTGTSIFETRVSPAGRVVGTSTVVTGWNGNGGLALLAMPDRSLRLFTPGTGGINTFTAPETGGRWTQQSGIAWGGAVAEASGVIGAALTKDGQPVTAWRGNAAAGVPPDSIPQNGYQGGMTASFLATDGVSGAVVLSGETNSGQGGAYVQQILPSPGRRRLSPPLAKDWRVSASGRIGAAGVYFANADGKSVRLYRYGGGSRTLAGGPYFSAAVCAGPEGRLWVAWGDPTTVYASRTSRAAGAVEPVQKLRLPSANGLTFLQCEGSAGPLDLFANDGSGFSHTHVLARLTVRTATSRTKAGAKVTISVRDAGDPVAGASVSIGGRHLRTGSTGAVTVALRPGSYGVSVTAPGYATGSASVHV